MIPFLLLGAVAVVGAVALAAFWKEIVQWIKKVYNKLPDSVKQNLQGAKAFLEKLGTAIKNIMKYYSYNENTEKWTETTTEREVSEDEVPKEFLEKMKYKSKLDITDDVQEKLELVA